MLSPRVASTDQYESIDPLREAGDTRAISEMPSGIRKGSWQHDSPKLSRNVSVESRELSERISTAERNAEENQKLCRTEKQRVDRSIDDDEDEEGSRKINFGDEVNVRFFNRTGSSLSLRGRSHSQNGVADLASCVKMFDGRSNSKSCLGKTTSYENLGDLESIAEEMGKPREMMMSGRRPRSRSYADLEEIDF
ncbi:hypothetical protein FOZ63_001061 [Perkinsus olseni]|uniref:Uncharacterized protein n=1 Tax=Perkinsus olseni TaxID=32597 RepID=A0A7J6QIC4_PEROL|nr:hypothetical protein FOZ62_016098 [Perkinsus olseni]KAF4750101.1 hypothetical protein FOZ63_001061 [Perkinsus olseni]